VLGFRQLAEPTLQGLRIDPMFESMPLVSQKAESIFDFGVWNRLGACVLYIGNTTWADPA